jgi:hypothetical protein
MKKLVMAVAAVVGLGFISAHAEEVDFDGQANGKLSFMEVIKNADSCQNDKITYEQPKPMAVSFENTKETISPSIIIAVDVAIKNVISSSAAQDNKLVKENLEQLLKKGSFEQKYEFVYGAEKVYHFPDQLPGKSVAQIQHEGMDAWATKSLTHVCIESVPETLCLDKQVCKYTCVIVGATVATWGSVNGVWQIIIPAAVGTEVCKDVCANVPVCTTSQRCVKWDTI